MVGIIFIYSIFVKNNFDEKSAKNNFSFVFFEFLFC